MPSQSNGDERGVVTKASPYPSVSETFDRLQEAVLGKGLEMQKAKVLIVGSPKPAPRLWWPRRCSRWTCR